MYIVSGWTGWGGYNSHPSIDPPLESGLGGGGGGGGEGGGGMLEINIRPKKRDEVSGTQIEVSMLLDLMKDTNDGTFKKIYI